MDPKLESDQQQASDRRGARFIGLVFVLALFGFLVYSQIVSFAASGVTKITWTSVLVLTVFIIALIVYALIDRKKQMNRSPRG
jgi:cbb3-type cytochrome oxidase subunit 3